MKAILRSPLHRLTSNAVMLVTVTGRKSGNTYTTPVNYVRDRDSLIVLSQDSRTWWKNLRGGAPVSVHLQGQDLQAIGQAHEDPEAVAKGLHTLAQRSPNFRKYLQIALTPDGHPQDPNALAEIARDRIIVRITDLKPQ